MITFYSVLAMYNCYAIYRLVNYFIHVHNLQVHLFQVIGTFMRDKAFDSDCTEKSVQLDRVFLQTEIS